MPATVPRPQLHHRALAHAIEAAKLAARQSGEPRVVLAAVYDRKLLFGVLAVVEYTELRERQLDHDLAAVATAGRDGEITLYPPLAGVAHVL